MLQINSGKLYPNGVGRTNALRGVLYSNLTLTGLDDVPIETTAGKLLQSESFGSPMALVYELTEQLEDGRKLSGVLVSHGVQPYLHDFAALVSFRLQVICTPDADLCSRLLSGKRSLGVRTPPSKLIRRVFDPQIRCQDKNREDLTSFVADLIGLRRKSFLAAMNAIRTYVTGIHRIADDLELAYTLLVAAIESLAQNFDGHEGSWKDYEESKRKRIDRALAEADAATADRVRAALVKIEHLALSRRFRDFALDHLSPVGLGDAIRIGALGSLDLRDALKEAYKLRSRYVHNLHNLPDLLSSDLSFAEAIRNEHVTFLTLEGLAKVARHSILEFVARQPKVEAEVYDYRWERYGIVRAQMSPEYWIGRPEGLGPNSGRMWLEAFLQQFASHLISKSTITDLSGVMARIEEILPTLNARQRMPLLSLYFIYNIIVSPENRSPTPDEIIKKYKSDYESSSIEFLPAYLLSNTPCDWSLAEHRTMLDRYFEQRNHANGFRVPELFEAGFILFLAERYRRSNDLDDCRALLSFSVDNIPSYPGLRALSQGFDPLAEIAWQKILLPAPPT